MSNPNSNEAKLSLGLKTPAKASLLAEMLLLQQDVLTDNFPKALTQQRWGGVSFTVSGCLVMTCQTHSFSDKTGKEGKNYFFQQWEYFPCAVQRATVWWEGKMRNTWAVKAFFHGNPLLRVHVSAQLLHTDRAVWFHVVPSVLIPSDRGDMEIFRVMGNSTE